jgi:hypothetical protein
MWRPGIDGLANLVHGAFLSARKFTPSFNKYLVPEKVVKYENCFRKTGALIALESTFHWQDLALFCGETWNARQGNLVSKCGRVFNSAEIHRLWKTFDARRC